MQKSKIKFILISCCTCKRPNMLGKSLESVKTLALPKDVRVELLVVDNDVNASAKTLIEELQRNFPIKINYFVEEKRGISNARNRLLKEALDLGATHISLFDDDEILDKNWLISHFEYYNQTPDAMIISGPTYNKFQKEYPKYIQKNNIFKSTSSKKTGLVRESCASGNVFFPTTLMSEADIYFDSSHVFMGGEDGDFFSRASRAGYAIVWNENARNYEIVDDERANLKWILNRYYYNGYSGYLLKHKGEKSGTQRISSLIKIAPVLILNCAIIPVSMMLGPTVFFNALGMACKTYGKLVATIKGKPLNYYENICGN